MLRFNNKQDQDSEQEHYRQIQEAYQNNTSSTDQDAYQTCKNHAVAFYSILSFVAVFSASLTTCKIFSVCCACNNEDYSAEMKKFYVAASLGGAAAIAGALVSSEYDVFTDPFCNDFVENIM